MVQPGERGDVILLNVGCVLLEDIRVCVGRIADNEDSN